MSERAAPDNDDANETVPRHPVGAGPYVVRQGDCLVSIADEAGHLWQTIWEHPDNQELRETRKSPNIVLPGDRLTIPPIRLREEIRPTDERHRFKKKGGMVMLRLTLLEDDRPRADLPYELTVDGASRTGVTNAEGKIEERIPARARHGRLLLGPDRREEMLLEIGVLDPISELTGVQGRLSHLGFDPGPIDGVLGPRTGAALRVFQQKHHLEVTGRPDDATRSRLELEHDS